MSHDLPMAVDRVPVVPQKNAPRSSPTHSQTPENRVPLSQFPWPTSWSRSMNPIRPLPSAKMDKFSSPGVAHWMPRRCRVGEAERVSCLAVQSFFPVHPREGTKRNGHQQRGRTFTFPRRPDRIAITSLVLPPDLRRRFMISILVCAAIDSNANHDCRLSG